MASVLEEGLLRALQSPFLIYANLFRRYAKAAANARHCSRSSRFSRSRAKMLASLYTGSYDLANAVWCSANVC